MMESMGEKVYVKQIIIVIIGAVILQFIYLLPHLLIPLIGYHPGRSAGTAASLAYLTLGIVIIWVGNTAVALDKQIIITKKALISGALSGALTSFFAVLGVYFFYPPVYGTFNAFWKALSNNPFPWLYLVLIAMTFGMILGILGAFVYFLSDIIFLGKNDILTSKLHMPPSMLALALLVLLSTVLALLLFYL